MAAAKAKAFWQERQRRHAQNNNAKANMIGNWEIKGLSEPKRYFCYAEAYLQASIDTCLRMKERQSQRTWPNASVALMLGAHSVELFFKGAILGKEPSGLDKHAGHDLAMLAEMYHDAYPDAEFAFDCPFQTEYLGLTNEAIEKFKITEPKPSILYRYPVKKPGIEWNGVHAFDPCEFLAVLHKVKGSYARLFDEFGDI